MKYAGLLVPTFAVRHRTDLGIGDCHGLSLLIDWSAQHGLNLLQLLPINETGADHSPYNAISSRALDPTTLYFHPGAIPGLSSEAYHQFAPQDKLTQLRTGSVHYGIVKPLLRELLQSAWHGFQQEPSPVTNSAHGPAQLPLWLRSANLSPSAFITFQKENEDWLPDYCLFRTLMEAHAGNAVWTGWPAEHSNPTAARAWLEGQPAESPLHRLQAFFAFIQWLCHTQWAALKAYASAAHIQLIGDIPFGVNRYSADTWAEPELFDLTRSGGAPPEPFFQPDLFTAKWGQNWGIPLYDWPKHQATNFRWWRARVKSIATYFHLFRIDHVLGFYRIFAFPWLPQQNDLYANLTREEAFAQAGDLPRFLPAADDNETAAENNRRQGHDLLSLVQEAAGDTGLLAEDLGVVPPYVRPDLTSLDIPGFKIPLFERNSYDGSYLPAKDYPELSIATFSTHDHLPLAAQWQEWTWKERQALEKQDPVAALQAREEKRHLLRWADPSMPAANAASEPPEQFTTRIHTALCRTLFHSPSQYVVLQMPDWFATSERYNVPGPASPENWSQRMPVSVEELDEIPSMAHATASLAAMLSSSGRLTAKRHAA